jgi:hypothetical protein
VYYASCRSDMNCPYRYQARFVSGSLSLFGAGMHDARPAVVRRHAAHPITYQQRAAVDALAGDARMRHLTPQDVHASVAAALGPLPGEAVRNRTKRQRRILVEFAKRKPTVESMEAWCVAREVQLDSPEISMPSDIHSLIVPRIGARPHQKVPVLSTAALLITFTSWAFVRHAVDLAGDGLENAFVGQSDFMFKTCWSGYSLGILGVQAYMKKAQKWHKHFVPLVFVLGLSEDFGHLAILLEVAHLLLRVECGRRQVPEPTRWFCQLHTDHTQASADMAAALPGTKLVYDLEHLYRNLRKSRDAPLARGRVSQIIRMCAFSAYLPTRAEFHMYWTLQFAAIREWPNGVPFVEYFRKTHFLTQRVRRAGHPSEDVLMARWFCGHASGLRAGHPSSQNLIEAFNNQVRLLIGAQGHHQTVMQLLTKFEGRFRIWSTTLGAA